LQDEGAAWLPRDIRQQVELRDKAVRVVCVFPFDCELDLLEVRLMETYVRLTPCNKAVAYLIVK
jgi:hypothetical protein